MSTSSIICDKKYFQTVQQADRQALVLQSAMHLESRHVLTTMRLQTTMSQVYCVMARTMTLFIDFYAARVSTRLSLHGKPCMKPTCNLLRKRPSTIIVTLMIFRRELDRIAAARRAIANRSSEAAALSAWMSLRNMDSFRRLVRSSPLWGSINHAS